MLNAVPSLLSSLLLFFSVCRLRFVVSLSHTPTRSEKPARHRRKDLIEEKEIHQRPHISSALFQSNLSHSPSFHTMSTVQASQLPMAKDFSSFLSLEAAARKKSPLKGLLRLMGGDMLSLGGG